MKSTLLLATFITATFMSGISSATDTLTVNLHFHITTELTMKKNGTKMSSALSKSTIRNKLLDDINNTWKPAKIRFKVASVNNRKSLKYNNRKRDIDFILNAGSSRSIHTISAISRLMDLKKEKDQGINVWIFPYISETVQGYFEKRIGRAVIGRFSDKMNGGKKPQIALVTEKKPMKKGSLARTIAHEIGHLLGLGHHNKKAGPGGYLMGGKSKQGYKLTAGEIKEARRRAKNL